MRIALPSLLVLCATVAYGSYGSDAKPVLTIASGDVAITQLVDGTMGVHVKMPKGIFR